MHGATRTRFYTGHQDHRDDATRLLGNDMLLDTPKDYSDTIRAEHQQSHLPLITWLIDGQDSRQRSLAWVIDKALLTVLTDKAISP